MFYLQHTQRATIYNLCLAVCLKSDFHNALRVAFRYIDTMNESRTRWIFPTGRYAVTYRNREHRIQKKISVLQIKSVRRSTYYRTLDPLPIPQVQKLCHKLQFWECDQFSLLSASKRWSRESRENGKGFIEQIDQPTPSLISISKHTDS